MSTSNVALGSETVTAEPPVLAPPPSLVKLSWGGLLGGLLVAVGLWLLLTVLGLAVNLTAVDPNDPGQSLKSVGVATGIWTVVVWVVALFAGAIVAAYTAPVLDRGRGAIHGVVLWSLATLLSIFLVAGVVRTVVRGAMATAEQAITAAGAAGTEVGQFLDLDVNMLVMPLNQRLRAQGRPTVTPEQVQAALRDVAVTAVREGGLDRGMMVESLSARTALSAEDAEMLADEIQAWFDARAGVAQDVRRTVLGAADQTGKAMWWVFLGLALGLGASVLGSTLGTGRLHRRGTPAAALPPAAPPLVPHEAHT